MPYRPMPRARIGSYFKLGVDQKLLGAKEQYRSQPYLLLRCTIRSVSTAHRAWYNTPCQYRTSRSTIHGQYRTWRRLVAPAIA
eukprot:62626-Rhodomonas_salina.4